MPTLQWTLSRSQYYASLHAEVLTPHRQFPSCQSSANSIRPFSQPTQFLLINYHLSLHARCGAYSIRITVELERLCLREGALQANPASPLVLCREQPGFLCRVFGVHRIGAKTRRLGSSWHAGPVDLVRLARAKCQPGSPGVERFPRKVAEC